MPPDTVLPEAASDELAAGAGDQLETAAPADETTAEPEKKPERHPLEKELAKERRRISRLVEQREQARAETARWQSEAERMRPLQNTGNSDTTAPDGDELRISRAELPKVFERMQGEAEQQRERASAASNMRKALGDDFIAVTDELAEIIPGDLQFAVAASEAPAELARYLIDPDNQDEAERIARMSPVQAGRALARIEAKLTAKPERPKASNAASPIEPVRGGAAGAADPSKMTDAQWLEQRRAQK